MASRGNSGDSSRRLSSQTSRAASREGDMLPASVEAVVGFGFPLDFVMASYRRLLTSRSQAGGGGRGTDVISDPESRDRLVTASLLLSAVEDSVLHSDGEPSSFDTFRSDRGDTVSSAVSQSDTSNTFFSAVSQSDTNNTVSSTASRSDTVSSAMTRSGTSQRAGTHNGDGGSRADDAASVTQSPQRQDGHTTAPPSDQSSLSQSHMLQSTQTPPLPEQATSGQNTDRRPVTNRAADAVSVTPLPAAITRAPTSSSSSLTTVTPVESRAGLVSTTPQQQLASSLDQAENRRHLLQRLRALRAENRRLRARQSCRNCRQRPATLTFLPCGHFCFCQECGSIFNACPVCRKTVLADVRTFVS